jgi:hypothetical protein
MIVESAKPVRLNGSPWSLRLGRLRARWLLWLESDIAKERMAARHGRRV